MNKQGNVEGTLLNSNIGTELRLDKVNFVNSKRLVMHISTNLCWMYVSLITVLSPIILFKQISILILNEILGTNPVTYPCF